ncbi:MAG TPA: hypothetical protein VIH78_11775 [Terriglobales bacterium]
MIWNLLRGCPITPLWEEILTSPRSQRDYFCSYDQQRNHWNNLDDGLTLYRGCSADPMFVGTVDNRRGGYFWTLSSSFARFMSKQGDKTLTGGKVFTMHNVQKSDCIFVGDGTTWEVGYLPNLKAHLEKYRPQTEWLVQRLTAVLEKGATQ